MSTVTTARSVGTRGNSQSAHVRTRPAFVHDADRRRDAISTRLTLRLSGVSDKQMAIAGECDRSTPNRWRSGKVDTPTTHFRRHLRKFLAAGAFPVAILADAAAEVWREAVRGWTPEEIRDRKRDLHRAETNAQHRVDVWQLDDIEGVAPECEDAIDEAILEHATRLIELYTLRQELRLLRAS